MNKMLEMNSVLSEKQLVIACDFFLTLRLYKLPDWLKERLKVAFPNIEIIPVNVPNEPLVHETASIYWGNRITPEIIQGMPKLKWIHFGSIGVNRIQESEVPERGILVTSSKGTVISSMVASALAFMTGLARGLHLSEALRREERMSRESFDRYFDQIHELSGERCLIVGFGDVGTKLAKVCSALDMKVSVVSRSIIQQKMVDSSFSLQELTSAATNADYVINLLPLNKETNGVFTKDVFLAMKSSAFFINIGRGETVDEGALIAALQNDEIAGAGLDVFSAEPLTPKSPLWNMKNVILSPHIAGLSSSYWDRQAELFMYNLWCYLEGDNEIMRNIIVE